MKNTQIKPFIKLSGWDALAVCCSSSGDTRYDDDNDFDNDFFDNIDGQTKVVRFTDFAGKQSIQWDSDRQPMYSSGGEHYLCENRNSDICVADNTACAVIVVNAAGKLRFRYTGPFSSTKGSFDPCGISTDSQCRILTTDHENHRIHILDQDALFLRFIDNCDLYHPWVLCVYSKDNLYVAESSTFSLLCMYLIS